MSSDGADEPSRWQLGWLRQGWRLGIQWRTWIWEAESNPLPYWNHSPQSSCTSLLGFLILWTLLSVQTQGDYLSWLPPFRPASSTHHSDCIPERNLLQETDPEPEEERETVLEHLIAQTPLWRLSFGVFGGYSRWRRSPFFRTLSVFMENCRDYI